jgi:DNA invertase Pin-like site-specific DNA recombinase
MATNGTYVAYYRVSTDRQGKSGLGLDAQRAAVDAYLNGGNWTLVESFTEVESGRRNDRPELAKALDLCRRKRATLVIARLDRLARNVAFIANLMDADVDVVAVDMPEANRFTLHIMAAMAEHEAALVSQRTKAALQAAKDRGRKLGWSMPSRRQEQAQASRNGAAGNRAKADRHAANVLPVVRDIERAGVTTLQGIADALNARGIRTARGRRWYASTVRNLLERTGARVEQGEAA